MSDYAGTRPLPSGCTVITVSKGDRVFFGGNDDYINPDSYYWADPGDSTRYGVLWIGTPDNVQQGINEKGLAYDANGLPRTTVNPHAERTPVEGDYTSYPIHLLHKCATVREVINWVSTHAWHSYMHDQMHFADATGDAVIISAGRDGEVAFTRKQAGDGFLVSTNFNVANPSNGYNYPCWRFEKANELLGQLIKKEEQLTAMDLTSIMDAVHQEGPSWTLETMVADLKNCAVYFYYFYQFDKPIVLNVKEELSHPGKPGPFSELFPQQVREEASKRYMDLNSTARNNRVTGLIWGVLIIMSLFLIFIPGTDKKNLRFWLPAVFVLGPIALVVRITDHIAKKPSATRYALVETAGNLVPVALSYLVIEMIIIIMIVNNGYGQELQLLLLIIPLLTAWILFHTALVVASGKTKWGTYFSQSFPQALITTFLALAGIISVSIPLTNNTLAMTQLMPVSPWIVLTWWAIIALGCLPGGLLVFIYEHWAVKRGYLAWSIFAGAEGKISTPKWSKIWWWVLLSIQLLVMGLIAGVIINKL